ncbi:MAG: polysaccharide pyruvyl transferase family protein, partial [Ginsengibacter sp.]
EETENIKTIKYTDPEELLQFMAELDVLISSKLHLGITGLTVNTPFLSYRGPGKAKSFLRSIGGDKLILDDNITFEDLNTTFFTKSKDELFNLIDIQLFNSMVEKSFGQFEFAEKMIEKYA